MQSKVLEPAYIQYTTIMPVLNLQEYNVKVHLSHEDFYRKLDFMNSTLNPAQTIHALAPANAVCAVSVGSNSPRESLTLNQISLFLTTSPGNSHFVGVQTFCGHANIGALACARGAV